MGANQPGDIEELCQIGKPTHGVITNISPAHLEGFGTIEAVAETKGALFQSLLKGTAFVNVTDQRVTQLQTAGNNISYGLTPDCDYPADLHHEKDGTITLTIDAEEVPTKSINLTFAKNVIACTAIARELDLEWDAIKDRIATFLPPKGRCEVINNGTFTIIDDTYNANLESTVAAIEYLKAFSGNGQRIFVFGDMFELGDSSIEQHQAIGQKCDEAELSAVLTVGSETIATDGAIRKTNFHQHFESKDDLLKSFNEIVRMKMETIVEAMLDN
jgi:UDP-N-acetylmuramoyl-tripeptide--D-alanyl-D-alanine ligase